MQVPGVDLGGLVGTTKSAYCPAFWLGYICLLSFLHIY